MRKSVKILGRTVPVVVIALAVMGTGAFAALLTYYGTITATANVYQSILLDGKDVNTGSLAVTDVISEAAPGGETFCFEHNLKNQMSVSGTVNFASDCSKDGYADNCGGITKNYYESVAYSYVHDVGSIHVTVEDTGDSLKWTYTGGTQMSVAINFPSGFVIHTSDGHCGGAGWYYSIDGGASCQALPSWATVTGVEGDGVKTVSIKKSALGDTFKWHGYSVKNLVGVWIGIGPDNGGSWLPKFEATFIGGALTLPVTILSKTTKDFYICYGFAQNIWPGIYTITTNVVPA
jgi:hypothetical protein